MPESPESLPDALIAFVELAGRFRFKPDEIANELHSLAKLGADCPKATVRQWRAEIDKALIEGRLSFDANGDLVSRTASAVQLLLF